MNLGEPLSSPPESWQEYAVTSPKRRVTAEGIVVVGLARSTRSLGKPGTRHADTKANRHGEGAGNGAEALAPVLPAHGGWDR